jgi:hypothetical protein
VAVTIALLAVAGVLVESASADVRGWLFGHPFASGILVGTLLIAATYLVVEQAVAERERRRWADATGPLLHAIAAAGAATDAELRAMAVLGARSDGTGSQQEWLGQLLERYQPALSATPELVEQWHDALSLLQHARASAAAAPPRPDEAYEAAWLRFRTTFAAYHDFDQSTAGPGTTWALLPAVPAGVSSGDEE